MEAFFIGVVGSLIASILIIWFMYSQRPHLIISNKIAKTSYQGKTVYAIKVINRGKRDVVSIRADLVMYEPKIVQGGESYNILEIPLERNDIFQLPPLGHKKSRPTGIFEFITYKDIEAVWSNHDNSYISFRIIGQDSLSGFSKVFSSEFWSQKVIEAGRFGAGDDMKISS